MKSYLNIFLALLLFTGCSKSYIGYYRSSCINQGEYDSRITLKSNKKIELKRAFWDTWDMSVNGEWRISGDTLILESDDFDYDPSSSEPQIAKQLTSYRINSDYFIVKGRKLFGLSSDGSKEPCYHMRKRESP